MPTLNTEADDRNRTSPFAFTGNKFEFRMPGSSSTPATTVASINSCVGLVLSEYADKLEKSKNIEKTVIDIISQTYKKHKRILFNGNGYSEEWLKEAEARGLKNDNSTNLALRAYFDKNINDMFEKTGMLTAREVQARYNAYMSRYVTHLIIESKTLIDIANKKVFPAGIKYSNILADNIEKTSKYGNTKEQKKLLKEILQNVNQLRSEIKKLEQNIEKVKNEVSISKQADMANKYLVKGLVDLRKPCDNLEILVDSAIWELPTYKDLLFTL